MINFAKCFKELTDYPPFAWQTKIYERFLTDEIPASCDIPTGLGKTSVIAIWLLALASKLIENPPENNIPRRLVYVVDRRVIVDQATDEAERILCKLKEFENADDEDLRNIFVTLQNASFLAERQKDDKQIGVIALSTLRGEYADNREWCLDPSRPAIIVGTIDMIGSRLLFSAYGGVGESYKALQAGLLGQDSLLVIDEAHLSPAFMEMLRPLKNLVNRKKPIKQFKVMSLSATPLIDEENEPFTLEKDAPEDLINPASESRLNAEKHLEWQSFTVSEEILRSKKSVELLRDEQAREMANAAAQYKDSSASVLVFGATVNLVKKIKNELVQTHAVEENQVKVMVGGMRGFERDDLVNDEVFRQFNPKREREKQNKSYFLIATSCAEVGVNLDADFAVCDVTSADSFIQRLGRVNRFGNGSAKVTIVHPENLENLERVSDEAKATFQELRRHENLNASPLELRRIEFDEKTCFPPKPVSPPLDKAKIDDWSMTSLKQKEFRRPLVSYWLRGVTVDDSTETSLCWRADFNHIVEAAKFSEKDTEKERRKNQSIEKKLRRNLIASVKTVRVKSRECARETTGRAKEAIISIAEKSSNQRQRVVIISPANEYEVCFLQDLKDDADLYKRLIFSTVIFPCEVGGLDKDGIADGSAESSFVEDKVEAIGKKFVCEGEKKNVENESLEIKPEWLRIIMTKSGDSVSIECLTQKENQFREQSYPNFKSAINAICKSENRKCVKTIDLTSASNDDEEEIKQEIQMAYLIAKKSPDAVLPNAADDDQNDDEDEASSIGYDKDKIPVELHNQHVSEFAKDIAEKLHLDRDLVKALELAGANHDKGKARECWQKAVGNFEFPEKTPLAKSNQNWFGHKYNNYYRHEFGSLIEAEENEEIKNHSRRDLILHLIAAHHGYARPHFPERAFDRENPKGANFEVAERAMLRFANLQIEYGWWQLAYLEAILKAADALASRAEARGEKI